MEKFCGRCGARLDEATGLCPNCDAKKSTHKEERLSGILKEVRKESKAGPRQVVPVSKKEAREKHKADKKVAKKERKAQKKATRKAEKEAKWAVKPMWKKLLSILLRGIVCLLMSVVVAVGIISVLGDFEINGIPVADDIFASPDFTAQYHVTPPDADEYFNNNSEVIMVIDANMSDDVLTEAQTVETLTERGFTEFSITSDYTMDGTYYDAADILETSTSKHPVYETYYVTGSGDVWTIIMINGRIMANPVSYNLQSNHGVQVIISETDTVTSYDGTTNQFYETIPHDSELIVKIVKRIDAETLESLTYGVIDGL